LILSFVPDEEQRTWRNMTRMKTQLTRDRLRLQNQMECLLEEMRIKLSIVVSDLLGASGLRILRALAEGETDPKKLAALGNNRLRWAIAHRLCRVVWKILHEGVRFIEQGSESDPQGWKQRARILARALRKLGYDVAITPINPATTKMEMQM